MSDEGNKFLKKQIILISTGPQRIIPIGGNQPNTSREDKPLNHDESNTCSKICSTCLETHSQECLKNTELYEDRKDVPGIASQKYCSRCCIFFGDQQSMQLNNLERDSDARKVELKNSATQDSRHSLLRKSSETKEVQTSKTDLERLDLFKLVLQLSECPCKQICKSIDVLDTVKQELFNKIPDEVVRTEKNIEDLKILSKTSNLVATTVCQMSLGFSVDNFYENESKCTVVDARRKSEQENEQNPFDILLKPKSSSVPQMKIEELKNRLKTKNKPKDTIGEINRMFANVRKNEVYDIYEQNRPSTRVGPRILPVVKAPCYLEDKQQEKYKKQAISKIENETKIKAVSHELNINKDKLVRISSHTTKSSNTQQQPTYMPKPCDLKAEHDIEKCILTLCSHHQHLDNDSYKNVQGDYKTSRTDNSVYHCKCRKNSYYKTNLQDSDLSSLSFS